MQPNHSAGNITKVVLITWIMPYSVGTEIRLWTSSSMHTNP